VERLKLDAIDAGSNALRVADIDRPELGPTELAAEMSWRD